MTATMTSDFLALCAAIDAGDDSALPALADWLEEAGDPRAAGLRRFAHRPALEIDAQPCRMAGLWAWHILSDEYVGCLAREVFLRLRKAGHGVQWAGKRALYPTRSAAYLALAEALAG